MTKIMWRFVRRGHGLDKEITGITCLGGMGSSFETKGTEEERT
jgi:hypothetical protein